MAVRVLSAGAVQQMVTELGAEFEGASGLKLDLNFATAGALKERIGGGESADLVIISESAVAALDQQSLFVAGSVTDLGRTVTGAAVRAGARKPDISTPEKFKQALLGAKNVAYTDPASGGTGGTLFLAVLDRLGIRDAVNRKAVLGKRGLEVVASIADGRAEIGVTFISEILPNKGVQVVGELPGDLRNVNTYTAAIPAGSGQRDAAASFLNFLTAPGTRARWTAAGLEPAFPN
jgi:molybdate transport system substrate-binding protein